MDRRRALRPDRPARLGTARHELLQWTAAHGATLEQMRAACAEGQLSSLVGDLSLRPGPRRTALDVAAAIGMEPELLNDVRRAAGLPAVPPDAPALSDDDVRMLELFQVADAFLSRDELLRLATVMGSAMRRIADAADEMFLRDVEAPLKVGDSPRDLEMAKANLAGIELARAATGVFAPMFLAHLQLSNDRTRTARRDSEDYETVPLAVGFVDLTGFTEMSIGLPSTELRNLIVDF